MLKRVLVLIFAFFVVAASGEAPKKYLELTTVNGKKIHVRGTQNGLEFKEFKGKIVFLEFFGTKCPPCLMSIPHYINLKNKYKDKLEILAIEVQATPASYLKEFVKEKGINYYVVPYYNASAFVDYIAKRAQWNGSIPFLIILNQKGEVVVMQIGLLGEKTLERVVDKLLAASTKKEQKDLNSTKTTPKK